MYLRWDFFLFLFNCIYKHFIDPTNGLSLSFGWVTELKAEAGRQWALVCKQRLKYGSHKFFSTSKFVMDEIRYN